MTRGRPLRFLVLALGGWVAARAVLLWPRAEAPAGVAAAAPDVGGEQLDRVAVVPTVASATATAVSARSGRDVAATGGRSAPTASALSPAPVGTARFARPPDDAVPVVPDRPDGAAPAVRSPDRAIVVAAPLPSTAPGGRRLAGSAWLIARGGASRDPLAGQLGGSQAGARLTYALDRRRRLAASVRVATPLGGHGGAEAAAGLDWRPWNAPLHLLAEQRVPLNGGRGGPALLAIGGVGPVAVARGVMLEGYAQAGAVARGAVEGFGDGAARLTVPVTGSVARAGGVRLDAGLGAWGGIQRGARRLDVGPTLGLAAAVGGKAVRVTLDWRARVAGGARPGSGAALSLGSDF